MKVTAIKTPLVRKNDSLKELIRQSIPSMNERSVLAISSKIVAYSQGRIVKKKLGLSKEEERKFKHELVKQNADQYLDPNDSIYNLMITITNNTISVNAGLDESNVEGNNYILWPEKMQETANDIWNFLREEYNLKEVGVVFTDSKTIPLRWGVVGTCLVHCGFNALYNCIGMEDLFGRKMVMETIAIAEAVTIAAVLEMGEVAERTPLAIVEDIKLIEFQDHVPTAADRKRLFIRAEDDVYEPFWTGVKWKKGGRKE